MCQLSVLCNLCMPEYEGWRMGERYRKKGIVGRQEAACQGRSPPLQWNKGISSLEGEVRINPNSWCWDLPVTVRSGGRKCRSLTSHGGFSFYLWPGLAVHGFPIPLPSSPRRPSSSPPSLLWLICFGQAVPQWRYANGEALTNLIESSETFVLNMGRRSQHKALQSF